MRTFNLVVLAILGLFYASCGSDDDRLGDWAKSVQFSGAPREAAISFTDEKTGTVFVGLGYGDKQEEFSDMYQFDGKAWTKLDTKFPAPINPAPKDELTPDLNGNGRHSAVAFVVGRYAYVGTGYVVAFKGNSGTGDNAVQINRDRRFFKDFYRFNLDTKQWEDTKITDFPGDSRRNTVAFSDGKYGYVGTGYGDNNRIFKDFYRYDPATNEWSEIAFSGEARFGGTTFVINNAAYVCLGSGSSGISSFSPVRDVLKFDFATQEWTKMGSLTDKPGISQDKDYDRIPRVYAISFVSNKSKDGQDYAYIATGMGQNSNTVWKYDHNRDRWHQMEDLSAYAANLVVGAVGFSVDGYGYYTTGAPTMDAVSGSNFFIDTWSFIPDVKETRGNDY